MRRDLLSSSLASGANVCGGATICLSAQLSQAENIGAEIEEACRLAWFWAQVSCSQGENADGFRTQNVTERQPPEGWAMLGRQPCRCHSCSGEGPDWPATGRGPLRGHPSISVLFPVICLVSRVCFLSWVWQQNLGDLGGETKTNRQICKILVTF